MYINLYEVPKEDVFPDKFGGFGSTVSVRFQGFNAF
jgi:hypothetical protein